MNIFRRLPLARLLLLCGVMLVAGVSITALAFALGSPPAPPAKPLAVAVHDALGAPPSEGVSANIKLTNNLLEGASLASGDGHGELADNPLLAGGNGRLWISNDGRVRLELQSEQGDTEILYDGSTLEVYDGATSTLYHLTPPPSGDAGTPAGAKAGDGHHAATGEAQGVPSLAKVEEAIAHLQSHVNVSGATPDDVAGHAAYTVRVSPLEGGSLLGGAELSFDAATGAPLRTAVYATGQASPVLELAATSLSYGAVPDSVFAFTPPRGTKIENVKLPNSGDIGSGAHAARAHARKAGAHRPKLSAHGHGVTGIAVIESTAKGAGAGAAPIAGLPQVKINGLAASELRTALGTVLSFERAGVHYVIAGSVTPATLEAFARGL